MHDYDYMAYNVKDPHRYMRSNRILDYAALFSFFFPILLLSYAPKILGKTVFSNNSNWKSLFILKLSEREREWSKHKKKLLSIRSLVQCTMHCCPIYAKMHQHSIVVPRYIRRFFFFVSFLFVADYKESNGKKTSILIWSFFLSFFHIGLMFFFRIGLKTATCVRNKNIEECNSFDKA